MTSASVTLVTMDENSANDLIEELSDEESEVLEEAFEELRDNESEVVEGVLEELSAEEPDDSEEPASEADDACEDHADDAESADGEELEEEESDADEFDADELDDSGRDADEPDGEDPEATEPEEAVPESVEDGEASPEEADESDDADGDGSGNGAEGFTAYADMREYSDDEDDEDDGHLSIFDWVIRIAFGISAVMILGSFSVIYALMSGCISLQQRHTIVEEGSVIGSEAGSAEDDELVQTQIPRFDRVEASSHRYSWNDAYLPDHVNDFDPQTVWAEGADGIGTGEWIELQADEPQVIVGLRIRIGYPSEEEEWRYEAFCRPADVDISLSDGTELAFSLEDKADGFQVIEFDEPHEVTSIRLTIETVHMGESYYDTCIAEIQAY